MSNISFDKRVFIFLLLSAIHRLKLRSLKNKARVYYDSTLREYRQLGLSIKMRPNIWRNIAVCIQ